MHSDVSARWHVCTGRECTAVLLTPPGGSKSHQEVTAQLRSEGPGQPPTISVGQTQQQDLLAVLWVPLPSLFPPAPQIPGLRSTPWLVAGTLRHPSHHRGEEKAPPSQRIPHSQHGFHPGGEQAGLSEGFFSVCRLGGGLTDGLRNWTLFSDFQALNIDSFTLDELNSAALAGVSGDLPDQVGTA